MFAIFSKNIVIQLLVVMSFNGLVDSTISCSFDSGFCGWHGVEGSNFQWKKFSGPSPDRTSGPLNDHTCNNYKGQYVYISGDDSTRRGDAAILESEPFVLEQSTVFEYWYLMNGIGVGNFSLELISANDDKINEWFKSGRQGLSWKKGSMVLEPGNFTLRFKATVKWPFGSDLAIDDVRLISEEYAVNKSHCKLPPTTTTTTTTTITASTTPRKTSIKPHGTHPISVPSSASTCPPHGSCTTTPSNTVQLPWMCTFDVDNCGIKIIASAQSKDPLVTWVRTNSPSAYNGPKSDHSGDGFYMHFDTGRGFFFSNPQYSAALETPTINSSDVVVSFWYNTPGQHSNLRVELVDKTNQHHTLWTDSTFEKGWHNASLSIHQDPPFKIMFVTRNDRGLAQVGIDDINIVEAPVSSSTTYVPQSSPVFFSTTTLGDINTPVSQKQTTEYSNKTRGPPSLAASTYTNNVSSTAILLTTTPALNTKLTAHSTDSASTSAMTANTNVTEVPAATVSPDLTTTVHSNTMQFLSISYSGSSQSPVFTSPEINNAYKTTTGTPTVNVMEKSSTLPTNTPSTIRPASMKPKPHDHNKNLSEQSKCDKLPTAVGASVGGTLGVMLLIMITVYLYLQSRGRARNKNDKVDLDASPVYANGSLAKDSELTVISNSGPHNDNIYTTEQLKNAKNGNLNNGMGSVNGHSRHNGSYIRPVDISDECTHF